MSRSDARHWISAIAFCAMLFQAFFAPGTAIAPTVDLAAQLGSSAEAFPPAAAMPAFSEEGRSSSPRPSRDGGVPFCPYWSCAWDLSHAGGLIPPPVLSDAAFPCGPCEVPARSFDVLHHAIGDDAHWARAPPAAA
jgi:hypothetical protein